ncbi:hypothetical protein FJU57_16915 [Acinetobacter baumannii]|nr:hypothetical protein FJU57_16915 [Acinetobacter baumannii]
MATSAPDPAFNLNQNFCTSNQKICSPFTDVAARDPQIQPKLMGYVRKRRYELENPTPTQQESTPDYLLVDGF